MEQKKIEELLNFIGKSDDSCISLNDYINVTRGEIKASLINYNSWYTGDFINLLVYCYNKATNLVKAYPAIAIELVEKYFIGIKQQEQPYAFIPFNVAYEKDGSNNHWTCLIIDKINQLILYLNPAEKIEKLNVPEKIERLKEILGFKAEIILNPIDFQRQEKEKGFLSHCGIYVIEMFESFHECVQQGKCISGSYLPNLDISNSISAQALFSRIPCGEVEAVKKIREKHFKVAYWYFARVNNQFHVSNKDINTDTSENSSLIQQQKNKLNLNQNELLLVEEYIKAGDLENIKMLIQKDSNILYYRANGNHNMTILHLSAKAGKEIWWSIF